MADLRTDLTDDDASATLHPTLHNEANAKINAWRPVINAEVVPVSPANSGTAYCWKGVIFRPHQDMDIYYITASVLGGTTFPAGTYQGALITRTGSTIDTIEKTESQVLPASNGIVLAFAEPLRMTSGVEYVMLAGRTDAGDTYAFPIITGGNGTAWIPPDAPGLLADGYGRAAVANLQVGSPIDIVATGSIPYASGFGYSLP